MKQENNILEQFENLEIIGPSPEWDNKLFGKLSKPQHPRSNLPQALLILIIVVLAGMNIYSFSRNRNKDKGSQESVSLKSVANEFLIYTNSSKF
jgi:hypothetical protein